MSKTTEVSCKTREFSFKFKISFSNLSAEQKVRTLVWWRQTNRCVMRWHSASLTSTGRGFLAGEQGLTEGHQRNRGRERRRWRWRWWRRRRGRGWRRGAERRRDERKWGTAGAGGGCCCRGNAAEPATRFCQQRREGRSGRQDEEGRKRDGWGERGVWGGLL